MEKVYLNPKSQFKHLFTGLRGTLLITFMLLSVVTVSLVATVGILLGTRTSRALVFEELVAEVELSERAINNWLDERQHDLAVIINNPADAEQARQVLSEANDQQAYESFLKRLQVETGPASSFREIFLINRDGQVLLSTDEDNVGTSQTGQSYFQGSLLAPVISNPFFNSAREENEIIMTVPVRDEFGSVVGVLASRLDFTEITNTLLNQSNASHSGETYLVSNDYRFLTQPRSLPVSDEARSEGIEQVLSPGQNRNGEGIYENYNGVTVVGAYRWIPDLEIALLSEREEREALAGVRQLGLISGGMAVFVLIVATGAALLITSRITQPISTLTEAATAIAQGNLDQKVTVEARNEIGLLTQAFNTMTERVRNLIDSLRERTRALETTNEISQQLTGILNLEELLQYIVNRIQTEFGFYHTQIYLFEEESGDLIMAEGSGEVGRMLKEKEHRLKLGQGLVGTAASTHRYFLSNNVDKESTFIRNPLLPDTKSELTIPLRKGDQLLGVLDIQSHQIDQFTVEDVSLVQSIANQLTVAIDNARLLAETQEALQKVERLNRRLTREAWTQFSQDLQLRGYRFNRKTMAMVTSDSDPWLPPMKQAAAQRQLVKQAYPGNGEPPKAELAVPLMLRGEVIGVLGVKREETPDWADEEVSAVEAVADQISRALENARLSREQERTIEQLKEIDRLKSEFLTSMSHELRTPLNSIIGFADVLLQGIDGDLPDLALNDIRLIHNSGQHLLALINDILDLSKIEAGKMELVREPLDINNSLKDVLAASSSLVKNKPVEIKVDTPANSLPMVFADKLRLNQILLNLVSNAAKFTEKGSITIKPRLSEEAPGMMQISIIDTGIGIPPEKLATIFDRFRQADSSTTRKYGGTGLGLAISLNLVQMHGGELKVKSQEDVGSEFYFTIPLAETMLSNETLAAAEID